MIILNGDINEDQSLRLLNSLDNVKFLILQKNFNNFFDEIPIKIICLEIDKIES